MTWKIYYADGSTFSSEDGRPEDAPGHGVLAIADKNAANTVHMFDWYYWRTDVEEWWGSNVHGVLYQFCKYPDITRAIKQGELVQTPQYNEVVKEAFAWRSGE